MIKPVNLPIAKLLKEKGFDELVNNYTSERDGNYFSNEKQTISYKNYNEIGGSYSRPTIAQVVMWLNEKHGIWVVVNIDIQNRWYFELFNLKDKRNAEILIDDEYWFNLPTEAYEAAIDYVLTNLI
jgi:hypothetical protein